MRTAIAPGVWRDDGPQTARVTARQYSAVPALAVGEMVPFKPAMPVAPQPAAHNARQLERIAAELEPQGRARCGEVLRVIGEPCARRVGHKYDHQSAAYVARWNARRRAMPRWKP